MSFKGGFRVTMFIGALGMLFSSWSAADSCLQSFAENIQDCNPHSCDVDSQYGIKIQKVIVGFKAERCVTEDYVPNGPITVVIRCAFDKNDLPKIAAGDSKWMAEAMNDPDICFVKR